MTASIDSVSERDSSKDSENAGKAVKPLHSAKAVLVGATGVGKTCLCERLVHNVWADLAQPTQGVGVYRHSFARKVTSGRPIIYEMNIYDTAGQERYMSLCNIYSRGADSVLVVWDAATWDQADRRELWLGYIDSAVLESAKDGCDVILVLAKADLQESIEETQRVRTEFVSTKQALRWTQEGHVVVTFAVSSMTGLGCDELLAWLEERALWHLSRAASSSNEVLDRDRGRRVIQLSDRSRKGCC